LICTKQEYEAARVIARNFRAYKLRKWLRNEIVKKYNTALYEKRIKRMEKSLKKHFQK